MSTLALYGPPQVTARFGVRVYRTSQQGCVAAFTDDHLQHFALLERSNGWENAVLLYTRTYARTMASLQYSPHNAQLGTDYRLRAFRR